MKRVRDLVAAIREQAVENVDRKHGYTMQFAPHPSSHRAKYDAEEARLASTVDLSQLICKHEDRIHPLGGGMFVCFACWLKLVIGGRS